MTPRTLTVNIDDLHDCRRAIDKLGFAIWKRHGLAATRKLFAECTMVSKRALKGRRNMRLLEEFLASPLSVDKFAASAAEKNKSLPHEYRMGPTGSTEPATIAKQIRRLRALYDV
jgi:hypothetical protein